MSEVFVPGDPFVGSSGFISTSTIGTVLGSAAAGVIRSYLGDDPVRGAEFPAGSSIAIEPTTRRRRRRKLLTCSDKSDIAFLVGQLGTGATGKAAIASLLSRRC